MALGAEEDTASAYAHFSLGGYAWWYRGRRDEQKTNDAEPPELCDVHGVANSELGPDYSGSVDFAGLHPVLDASLAVELAEVAGPLRGGSVQRSGAGTTPSKSEGEEVVQPPLQAASDTSLLSGVRGEALRAALSLVPASIAAHPDAERGLPALSDALRVAAPPPPFVDPAPTEDDVLAAWAGDVPDYGGALSPQEARDLASLLTAPFLRAPLALAFFARRPGTLVQRALRDVVTHALFEPQEYDGKESSSTATVEGQSGASTEHRGATALVADDIDEAVGALAYVPVMPDARPHALGQRLGALAAELAHAPGAIVEPLLALLRTLLQRCHDAAPTDGRAPHTAVLLWAVRLAARTEGVLAGVVSRRLAPGAAVSGAPSPETYLAELRRELRGPALEHLARCAAAAEAVGDVPVAAALHAHVVVIWGGTAAEGERCGALCGSWDESLAPDGPAPAALLARVDVRSLASCGYAHVLCSGSYVAVWGRAARAQAATEARDEVARRAGGRGGRAKAAVRKSPFMRRPKPPAAATSAVCDVLCSAPWGEAAAICVRLRAGLLAWLDRLARVSLVADADADWKGQLPQAPHSAAALAAATGHLRPPAGGVACSGLDGALSLCVCIALRSPRLELRAFERQGAEAFKSRPVPGEADALAFTFFLGVGVLVNGHLPVQLPPAVAMHTDYRDAVLSALTAADAGEAHAAGTPGEATNDAGASGRVVDATWLCSVVSAHAQRSVLQVQRGGAVYELAHWAALTASAPPGAGIDERGHSRGLPRWVRAEPTSDAATAASAPATAALARLTLEAEQALKAARAGPGAAATALLHSGGRYTRLYVPGSGALGAALGPIFDEALRDAAIDGATTSDHPRALGPIPSASPQPGGSYTPFVFLSDALGPVTALLMWLPPPRLEDQAKEGVPPLLGTFFEVVCRGGGSGGAAAPPPVIEVFQLLDVGRAAQRCLVWTSDRARSLRALSPPLHPRRTPWMRGLSGCGGSFLGAAVAALSGGALPTSVRKRAFVEGAADADGGGAALSEVGLAPRIKVGAGIAHIPVGAGAGGVGGAPTGSAADVHSVTLGCDSLVVSRTVKVGSPAAVAASSEPSSSHASSAPLPPSQQPMLQRHTSSQLGADVQTHRESFVPPRCLLGLLPEALLLRYELWVRRPVDAGGGEASIVGYPRSASSAALPAGAAPRNSRGFAEADLLRVCVDAQGSAVITLEDAGGSKPPTHAGSSAVAAAVLRAAGRGVPSPGTATTFSRADGCRTLLCASTAPAGSPLARLLDVLATAESASHILVWGRGVTVGAGTAPSGGDARALVLERVELPRLRLSFDVRLGPSGDAVLLASSEHTGFALSDEWPRHLGPLAAGLPLSLVLAHAEDPGQLLLLTPCAALRRPVIMNQPFATGVVPVLQADWASEVRSRTLAFPVHPSGAMLVYRSTMAALYHVASLLWTRCYDDAAAVLHVAALDGPPDAVQRWLLRHLLVSSDDRHPCALALRLRVLVGLFNAAAGLADGGTLASQGLRRQALHAVVASPFALLGRGSGDPWGVAWAALRSWIQLPAGVTAPRAGALEGLELREDGVKPLPPYLCPLVTYVDYLVSATRVSLCVLVDARGHLLLPPHCSAASPT